MKRMILTSLALALVFAVAPVTSAQDEPAEMARGAIDPYVPGTQRAAFLRAAGVDSEMNEAEHEADSGKKEAFVRSYDKWATMKLFDRNRNGSLDWFEADAYRRAVRQAVLNKYDINEDKKLTGPEREALNKALAEGKLPKIEVTRTVPDAAPAPAPDRPRRRGAFGERRAQYDKDGDGELSPDERRAMASGEIMRGRDRMVSRFDSNGDGLLDASERATAEADEQGKWWLKVDDLGMKHFDADGDGKLSQAESDAIVAFGEKLQAVGKGWERDVLDTDGDGEVSQGERQAFQAKVQAAGIGLLPRAIKWADSNGDGTVSADERREVAERVAKQAEVNIAKWTNRFDANGDGRLDVGERDALIKGIDEDARARYDRHDKDGDGQLSAPEIQGFIIELAEEWGVAPQN